MTIADKRDRWVQAALNALARGGIEDVRVEVIAKDLGVTKGGFYRCFADRRALLDALLDTWARGRIAAIEQHTQLDGSTAQARLRALVKLYSVRVNPKGMAIEIAIRQWSRTDAPAARAVAAVDAARLKHVAQLYAALGGSRDDADALAFLFYSFIFGQSLLQIEQGPRRRSALFDACTTILTDAASHKK